MDTQTIAGQQTDTRWTQDRQYMENRPTIDGQHTDNRYIKLGKQMQMGIIWKRDRWTVDTSIDVILY